MSEGTVGTDAAVEAAVTGVDPAVAADETTAGLFDAEQEAPAAEGGKADGAADESEDIDPFGTDPDGETTEQDAEGAAESEDGSEAEAEDGSEDGVPEEYTFKLPEGVEIADEDLADVVPLLKDMGATQDQAQALIDIATRSNQGVAAQIETSQKDAWSAQLAEWDRARASDPDLIGTKGDESRNLARAAVKRYGGAELAQFMRTTGYGRNPVVEKAWASAARATGEGTAVAQTHGARGNAKSQGLAGTYDPKTGL